MTTKHSRFGHVAVWAAVLVCLLAQAGLAATYYVATPANGGNDATGDGSMAKPWATINYADTLKDPADSSQPFLKPGDTVIVTAGTYTVTAAVSFKYTSGAPGAPITYLAQGDVIIDAGSIAGPALQVTALSGIKGPDYLVFDGFTTRGGKRSIDIVGGSYLACREGIVVRNCVFGDVRGTGTALGGYMLTANNVTKCEIYNNIFYISANPGANVGANRAISFASTGYMNKVFNNTVYISGPASALPNLFYGGVFFNNYSTYDNSGWANVDWMQPDEFGGPTDIVKPEYADQLRNNIVWVKNAESYGVWDYTNQGLTPNRSLGLQHTNNMFWWSDPATQLRFIADYLASGNCSSPGVPDYHEHIYKETESAQDPMFVSAAPSQASDFALAPGSPAIDAGVDVGLPYYGSAPDLGAIETIPAGVETASIAEAAAQEDGSGVKLLSSVVTVGSGVLQDNMIYVEDETRSAGIAVKSSASLLQVIEGQRVEITGVLDKSGAQPVINALKMRLAAGPSGTIASTVPLRALGVTGKSVSGVGLDNAGLFAKVWGKVTFVAPDNSYFCVDDGSGKTDGSGHAGVPVVVSELVNPITALPDASAEPFVVVTGVLGKKDLGNGVVAVIRPRGAADIQ